MKDELEAIKLYRILRDEDRYHNNDEKFPLEIWVRGTYSQAEFLADDMSLYYAGCDGYFYVEDLE